MPLSRALSRSSAQVRPNQATTLVIVTPPYPCAGTGLLRVIRAAESADGVSLWATYEGFVRL